MWHCEALESFETEKELLQSFLLGIMNSNSFKSKLPQAQAQQNKRSNEE